MRDPEGVRYLQWIIALRAGGIRLDLTQSGLATPLDRLDPEPGEVMTVWGGDPGIRRRIAARYGVSEDEVLPTLGTSFALWLAAGAAVEAGDEALVETPGYESLAAAPESLGATVVPFARRPDADYRLEPEAILERLTPRTRLVVVSDLHNPSGAATPPETIRAVGEALDARGVHLLVDEVYRDFGAGPVGTARAFGGGIMTVSSLTKVYGLGGLRAGWVLAPPDRIDAMRRRLTVLEVHDPAPQIPWFRAALDAADALREEALARAARGRAVVEAWAGEGHGIAVAPAAGGVCAWLRLPGGLSGERAARILLENSGVGVVPGSFFGDASGLRVGIGAEPEVLREGLAAIARTVAAMRAETPGAA